MFYTLLHWFMCDYVFHWWWYLFAPKPVWMKMINGISCILRFLLLLKPTKGGLFEYVNRNHERSTVKDVFSLIDFEKKKAKCNLDIQFLLICKSVDIYPKFLRFKLYKKSLHGSQLYRTWQAELLDQGVSSRYGRIRELERSIGIKRRLLSWKG